MPPVTYTLSDRAYVKLVLHALKHPTRAVCGVLVGRASGDAGVEVVDALPMLHSSLAVTPCAEIALEQCAAHAELAGGGLRLVGYYHANELARDGSFRGAAAKIADAVHAQFPGACAMLIDPARLARAVAGGAPPLKLLTRAPGAGAGAWEPAPEHHAAIACAGRGERKLARCHADGREAMLVDFDDHLDDPADDWRNPKLDPVIAAAADDAA